MKKAYLVLSNGMAFEGYRFGAQGDTLGEVVFTTGVCGYIETMTDPSYYGQIVLQTFPMIGNYGMIEEDFDGDCVMKGYIVREWCENPSNFRCQYTVDQFLKDKGIPGLYGVDTREITRVIRENGVMNGMICDEIPADLSDLKNYKIVDAVKNVSRNITEIYPAEGEEKFRVTLIDYGAKWDIVQELCKRGCRVHVVPYHTTAEKVLASAPDGVMLSNGPGDPKDNPQCIAQIQKMLGKVPMFGICMGHQMMALALGGDTEKLKYGHRGGNQPVKDLQGVRTYMTNQNHGYTVIPESVQGFGKVIYQNLNDGTCEGIEYLEHQAFSVQFHPAGEDGPQSTMFVYDKFIELMGGEA